jgi:hypothetical protein
MHKMICFWTAKRKDRRFLLYVLVCACAALQLGQSFDARSDSHWVSREPTYAELERQKRHCSIPRIDVSSLSESSFREKFYRRKPVLLTGVTKTWQAMKRWQKADLLRHYGDSRIEVGEASEIIAFDGAGSMYSSLRDVVSNFGTNHPTMKDPFVFDSSEVLEFQPQMQRDFDVPSQFQSIMDNVGGVNSWQMLSIGDDDKGLHFHSHGDSWLGLVFGAKRWLMYPPGRAPQSVFESLTPITPTMHDWTDVTLPQLDVDDHPIDCVQRSGEAMYVPAGWLHATVNMGETIGVGGQASWPAQNRASIAQAAISATSGFWSGAGGDVEAYRNLGIAKRQTGSGSVSSSPFHILNPVSGSR